MLDNLTILEASKLIDEKKATALEITNSYIKKIEHSKKLNCFITVSKEDALQAAKETDNRVSNLSLIHI